MTEKLGVSDRQSLLAIFEDQLAVKNAERESLRTEVAQYEHQHGDLCDNAQGEIDNEQVRYRISILNEDIARIRAVGHLLRTGWDGTCIDCREVSVVPRLKARIASRRCCDCKTEREIKERKTNKSFLGLSFS